MFQAVMLAFAAAEQAILLVQKLTAVARQNAELTPEQEQSIHDRQQALIQTSSHWQVEPDPEP